MFRESVDSVTHELTGQWFRFEFTPCKSESQEHSIWHGKNDGVVKLLYPVCNAELRYRY